MTIYLKDAADIAALINGPDYTAITVARKTEIADHFEAMPASVWAAALAVMLTTYSADEQIFAQALFTDTPPDEGSAPAPTTPTPTVSDDNELMGLLPIPAGATQVAIPFSPAFASEPLPPQCTVVKASPGDNDISVLDVENLSASGCVAILSSATGNGNYQLSFRAVLPS